MHMKVQYIYYNNTKRSTLKDTLFTIDDLFPGVPLQMLTQQ